MNTLSEYMKPFDEIDKGFGNYEHDIYCKDSLDALPHYMDSSFEIIDSFCFGFFNGYTCALAILNNETFVIWRDSFGTCEGCDSWIAARDYGSDEDKYNLIKATLQEGNTRQFNSIDGVIEYLETTDDYWWWGIKEPLLKIANKYKETTQ